MADVENEARYIGCLTTHHLNMTLGNSPKQNIAEAVRFPSFIETRLILLVGHLLCKIARLILVPASCGAGGGRQSPVLWRLEVSPLFSTRAYFFTPGII